MTQSVFLALNDTDRGILVSPFESNQVIREKLSGLLHGTEELHHLVQIDSFSIDDRGNSRVHITDWFSRIRLFSEGVHRLDMKQIDSGIREFSSLKMKTIAPLLFLFSAERSHGVLTEAVNTVETASIPEGYSRRIVSEYNTWLVVRRENPLFSAIKVAKSNRSIDSKTPPRTGGLRALPKITHIDTSERIEFEPLGRKEFDVHHVFHEMKISKHVHFMCLNGVYKISKSFQRGDTLKFVFASKRVERDSLFIVSGENEESVMTPVRFRVQGSVYDRLVAELEENCGKDHLKRRQVSNDERVNKSIVHINRTFSMRKFDMMTILGDWFRSFVTPVIGLSGGRYVAVHKRIAHLEIEDHWSGTSHKVKISPLSKSNNDIVVEFTGEPVGINTARRLIAMLWHGFTDPSFTREARPALTFYNRVMTQPAMFSFTRNQMRYTKIINDGMKRLFGDVKKLSLLSPPLDRVRAPDEEVDETMSMLWCLFGVNDSNFEGNVVRKNFRQWLFEKKAGSLLTRTQNILSTCLQENHDMSGMTDMRSRFDFELSFELFKGALEEYASAFHGRENKRVEIIVLRSTGELMLPRSRKGEYHLNGVADLFIILYYENGKKFSVFTQNNNIFFNREQIPRVVEYYTQNVVFTNLSVPRGVEVVAQRVNNDGLTCTLYTSAGGGRANEIFTSPFQPLRGTPALRFVQDINVVPMRTERRRHYKKLFGDSVVETKDSVSNGGVTLTMVVGSDQNSVYREYNKTKMLSHLWKEHVSRVPWTGCIQRRELMGDPDNKSLTQRVVNNALSLRDTGPLLLKDSCFVYGKKAVIDTKQGITKEKADYLKRYRNLRGDPHPSRLVKDYYRHNRIGYVTTYTFVAPSYEAALRYALHLS